MRQGVLPKETKETTGSDLLTLEGGEVKRSPIFIVERNFSWLSLHNWR